jgi:subtilisin family serine protease
MMKRLVTIVILAGLSVGLWGPSVTRAANPTAEFAPGEVVVQYREGTGDAQQRAARGRVNALPKQTLRRQASGAPGLELLTLPAGANVYAAIATLQNDPAVAFAEPNWVLTRGPVVPAAVASDRGYANGSHWNMYGDATSPYKNAFGSQAGEAWAAQPTPYTGSKAVFVGVIDEGIKYEHCDLKANIWTNPGETGPDGSGGDKATNDRDDDDNGYADDVHGWDFYHGDDTVYDGGETGATDNHGTHVAGNIGAAANNMGCDDPDGEGPELGGGTVGVNWDVTLISGKFLGPDGGYTHHAVQAIEYFTSLKTGTVNGVANRIPPDKRLNIVALNNSWGGGGYSQALHDAIIRAAKANILFIAAAGNDGRNNDAILSYPSGYNTTRGTSTESAAGYDSVIAVAAIASDGSLAGFSNWGRATVDLGAPGVNIWSTTADWSYSQYSGTSMATPHVTGAAALYAAQYHAKTGQYPSGAAIRNALLQNTAKTGSLSRKTVTGGRLDISCALSLATCQR